MKKYQKAWPAGRQGFAPVLILGLVVIVGAVLYFVYTFFGVRTTDDDMVISTLSPVATVTPMPSRYPEISNSKTYTNTKYGYSLITPSNWSANETEHIIDSQLVSGQKVSKLTLKGSKTTIEVFFEGEFDHGYMPWEQDRSEDIVLGNKTAKKVTLSLQGNVNKWIVITIPDFHYFRIEIQGPADDLSVVDQILSTFKFTN